MVLERFFAADFAPRALYPDAPRADLPDTWPFGYADLAPHYDAAERLYGVHGGRDPARQETLSDLPSRATLPPNQQRLFDHFQAQGLHPYQLPVASAALPDCQHCQGYLCSRDCKHDSAHVCVKPAIRDFGAVLLDECEVTGLRANGKRVTEVVCQHQGQALELRAGTVILATGALPPAAMLVESLQDDLRQSALPWLGTLITPANPIIRTVLDRLARRVILATVLEDLPYRDNRVMANAHGVALSYRLSLHETRRIRAMRQAMKQSLKGLSPLLIKQAENNQRLAHVCGTCRAGVNPADSVVDAQCRAHDLDNLYIADASFFPSSGGTNPALTIAANALRVAERICSSPGG